MILKKYAVPLRIFLTSIILILIVYMIGPAKIIKSFAVINWYYFFLALLLALPRFLIKTLRWQILIKRLNPDSSFKEAFTSLLVGIAAGLITPLRLGQVSAVFYVSTRWRSKLAGLVFLEMFLDLVITVCAALLITGSIIRNGVLFWICLSLVLAAFTLFLFPKKISLYSRQFLLKIYDNEKIQQFISSLDLIHPRLSVVLLALSWIIFVFNLAQFTLLVNAFEKTSWHICAITFPIITLLLTLPITVAGLGVREGGAVLLMRPFGVSEVAAANGSFLTFFINIVIPGMLGSFLISRYKRIKSSNPQNELK